MLMGKKNEFEKIAEEAQEGYDLRDRLMGMARREKKVTVFTDNATGAELGGAEDILIPGTDLKSGQRRRWGVAGEMDEIAERAASLANQIEASPELAEVYAEEIKHLEARKKALSEQAKKLLKKLQSTAFDFTLHAVPDLVLRDTRRQARKNLGIKQKGIEGREEEFQLEYTAILLAASVASWVDRADGKKRTSLSVDEAKALRDLLPAGQFQNLDAAMYELSLEVSIGRAATDSADF